MVAFNAPGHIIFGIITACIVSAVGVPITTSGMLFVVFGSLLPDIDHRNSTLGRYNLINRTRFCKHRGRCHTVIGVIFLTSPFYILGDAYIAFLVLFGAVGHLIADKLYSILPKKKAFTIKLW